MNGDWYIRNILEEHVVSYVDFIGNNKFVLMHGNARAHAIRTVTKYLQAVEWRHLSGQEILLTQPSS